MLIPYGLFLAWMFMLTTAVVHRHWWGEVPPTGFGVSLVLVMLSMIVGGISGFTTALMKIVLGVDAKRG